MSGLTKTVLNIIVYTPLVLLALYFIYLIAYGIYFYRINGHLPPSYETGFSIIKRILLIILYPIKLLLKFLWWLIPIFPGYRGKWGFRAWGAWDKLNISRTILLLTTLLFITIYVLFIKYGAPIQLQKYALSINYILIGITTILLLASLIQFYKNTTSDFPDDGNFNEKSRWLISSTGNYLYYIIAVGLALGILFAIGYYMQKNKVANLFGLTTATIIAGVIAMFMLYGLIIQNTSIKKFFQNNPLIKVPFYLLFIIPCIFFDTVTFLFNHFRHTPKSVYYILSAEIIFISMYLILPIIQNYIYTITSNHSGKDIIIQNKINDAENLNIILEKRINDIKNTSPPDSRKINEDGWKNIITNNLNNPEKEEELILFLLNYGYKTKELCDGDNGIADKENCKKNIKIMTKIIQQKTTELIMLQSKLKENNLYIEKLKEQKKNIKKTQYGKVLLKDPIYLNKKKWLGNFEDLKMQNYTIEYNYNYSISSWFFIHAQPPNYKSSYNKYTSILNYNDKPNILYNSSKNTLLIKMNNGKYKQPRLFKIEKFPLQKWNNIVINYDGGTLDIFMNSKLVASMKNTIPYMSIDEITVGSKKGVAGGVCNVVYFPIAISYERIKINYELLKNKNPPVI